MARRWLSKGAPTRGEDAIAAVLAQLANRDAVRKMIDSLSATERALLEVVARYGGRVAGEILQAEITLRKLSRTDAVNRYYGDPLLDALAERGLLTSVASESGWSRDALAERECPPSVVAALTPARVVPWPLRPAVRAVEAQVARAHDAIALETLAVARACEQLPSMGVNQGGALAAPTRKRLEKALPNLVDDESELAVPSRIELSWQLLRGLDMVRSSGPVVAVDVDALAALLARPGHEVAFALVRAWLSARHWQDGLGAVPENDRRNDAITRYGFDETQRRRELLAWALGRFAHHQPMWLDVESFLLELHPFAATSRGVYGPPPRLSVRFAAAENRDSLPRGDERDRAFWLATTGVLLANMLLVTLVHFGLVERGLSAGERRWAFRLTPMGRAVFGAPDVAAVVPEAGRTTNDTRPLVVQADFDVLLHVKDADLATRATLGRFATLVSDGERVSRYRLEAASIRGAVDGGMTAEAILEFLARESRTEVPRPVAVAIDEWSAARESVVLHGPGRLVADEHGWRFADAAEFASLTTRDTESHPAGARKADLEEDGSVTGSRIHPLAVARLARVAERTPEGFRITRESVQAARASGLPAAQIESWILASVKLAPSLFRARLKHWLSGTTTPARTEKLTCVRVDDAALEHAIASSPRFAELGLSRIAPGYLRIDERRVDEITSALAELGVVLESERATVPPVSQTESKPRKRRSSA